MSVLIKGMEMPKNCDSCPCYYETEGAWRDECQVLRKECAISEERPSWCPLVEIPPHGRLIDADALDDAFTDLRWENGDYKSGALLHWGDRPNWCLKGSEIESLINAAPTIIEAADEFCSFYERESDDANTSNALNALDCVESEGE